MTQPPACSPHKSPAVFDRRALANTLSHEVELALKEFTSAMSENAGPSERKLHARHRLEETTAQLSDLLLRGVLPKGSESS